jgi:sec-independent protein translocase protein TatC
VPERVALGPFSTGVRPAPLSLSGLVGADGLAGQALLGTTSGLAVVAVTVFAYMLRVLNQPVHPRPGPGGAPDPESIDLGELDAAGVRSAPPEAFEALSEDEAVDLAGAAMDADDPEKAQAILDRFDEVDEAEGDGEAEADEDEENVLAGTAAGMADAFTEEETTEEDVGGYYYDVAFVLRSLTSKAFRIVGVFMGVLSVVFFWLYQGGLGQVKRQFLERVDREVLAEVLGVSVDQVDPASANFIVALHPVEQLVFEIKVATLLGAVAAAPVLMYYAWPAIKERGLGGGGSSGVFLVWGVTLLVGTVGGSLLGFFVVAPTVISFLVEDALAAQMVVSFRLKAFFWLVLFTTVGVGLLADVPLTMLLFDRGGIVSYETMAKRWRGVVLGVVAVIGFLTPQGALTMIVLSAPVVFAYAVGLGLLWLVTLPRRARGGGGAGEQPTAD